MLNPQSQLREASVFQSWRLRHLLIIVVLAGTALIIENILFPPKQNKDQPRISNDPQPISIARTQSSVPGAAFVFLGLGAQAYQMNCGAAIESLVRHGGWNGDVYLITDRADCFDKQKIISNADIDSKKFHLKVVAENFGGGGADLSHLNIGFASNRIRSKSMKTQLFNLVDDPAIDVIGYADCDVLFAREGCPRDFILGGEPWDKKKIQFTRVDLDDTGRMTGLHAGTIVMHRDHSKEVLDIWAEEIDKMESLLDRVPYLNAYKNIQQQIDSKHHLNGSSLSSHRTTDSKVASSVLPHQERPSNVSWISRSEGESGGGGGGRGGGGGDGARVGPGTGAGLESGGRRRHLRELNRQRDMYWPTTHKVQVRNDESIPIRRLSYLDKQYDTNPMLPGETRIKDENGRPTEHFENFMHEDPYAEPHCINHISKTRCEAFGRSGVQLFVDRFRLRTYEGGHQYCAAPVLQPLLYGWFPFSYLPFCLKIEQLL